MTTVEPVASGVTLEGKGWLQLTVGVLEASVFTALGQYGSLHGQSWS